jgi:methionyl-tRNA formyltransferase
MSKIQIRSIILGDEVGIPILSLISNNLEIEIVGALFSKKVSISARENIVKELNIPVLETRSRDNYNLVLSEFIKNQKIDIILMFSYDIILDSQILDIPGIRIINIHGGKIPSYRGANVLNWAIINGEKEIGVTIHEARLPVDSGPIIGEWSLLVDQADTALTVREKICNSVIEKAPQVLSDYLFSRIIMQPPKKLNTIAYKKRVPDDGLFDWTFSDNAIHNLIRGLVSPWPGARYIDRNGRLVIINEYMSINEITKLRIYECG